MVKHIWKDCRGDAHIGVLQNKAWRIVEAQEAAATRKLVDSLEEQMTLEDMIESVKPRVPNEYLQYHPLLYTAFRYPPLRHGSRFASRFESSLWYGSLHIRTALAEKAYYQYHFMRASDADYGVVSLQLTAFSVDVKTNQGINLAASPFSKYIDIISSPDTYSEAQQLGFAMREANVYAFTYHSARDPDRGLNIGSFTPKAFAKKIPDARSFQSWQCVVDYRIVEFMRSSAIETESHSFPVDLFFSNGALPFPAA